MQSRVFLEREHERKGNAMTIKYSGYGYERATKRERAMIARRDRIVATWWHDRLTHDTCDGQPYCHASVGNEQHGWNEHAPRRYYTGNLHAPCSRYGRDGDECAWWAIAAAFIAQEANSGPITWEDVDYWQGLAVNDSGGLADLVWDGWHAVPPFVRGQLGTRASVLALSDDPAALRAGER